MKRCSKCKANLLDKYFTPNLNNYSELSAQCKECVCESKSELRKDPVYLEYIRNYANEYYHLNKDKIKAKRIQREIKKDKK